LTKITYKLTQTANQLQSLIKEKTGSKKNIYTVVVYLLVIMAKIVGRTIKVYKLQCIQMDIDNWQV